ncbi:MAG: DUF3109 family protein [Bryobacterales bacterium]|nr:DUF3109 family protein [Bryobacterales bacterium]
MTASGSTERQGLRVLNLAEARFECTFGRGCEGVCCRNGRPPLHPSDEVRIKENVERFAPLMRDEARQLLRRAGFLTRRRKSGLFTLRVVSGWCIFFHRGCVLEQAGRMEGDRLRYKPTECALFPLEQNPRGEWFVRQKNYGREDWDLFCLDPASSARKASESLREELALAERWEASGMGSLPAEDL